MARRIDTVRGRLVLMVLVVQALLLPPLFLVLDRAVERTMTNYFVDEVRAISEVIADEFSALGELESPEVIVNLLDAAMLGGYSSYATLQIGDDIVASSLLRDEEVRRCLLEYGMITHNKFNHELSRR